MCKKFSASAPRFSTITALEVYSSTFIMAHSKCAGDLEQLLAKYKEKEVISAMRRVNEGQLFKSVTKLVLNDLHEQLNNPIRAVNAVVKLGIPVSKYNKFSSLMKGYEKSIVVILINFYFYRFDRVTNLF